MRLPRKSKIAGDRGFKSHPGLIKKIQKEKIAQIYIGSGDTTKATPMEALKNLGKCSTKSCFIIFMVPLPFILRFACLLNGYNDTIFLPNMRIFCFL